MSDKTKYIPMYVPFKERLAKLLTAAKGDGRTMAEFAKVCGVSPTTFSRITSGHIKKPLSEKLIRTIADNSADRAKANYDTLMRANGMVAEKERNERFFLSTRLDVRRIKSDVQSIISQELFDRKYMIAIVHALRITALKMYEKKSRFGLSFPSSFGIRIQGYDPLIWNIIIDNSALFQDTAERTDKSAAPADPRVSLDRYSSLFLSDTWEKEILSDFKNTIVFTDRPIYDAYKKKLMTVRVNTDMSLMLVDTELHRIVEEAALPRADGKVIPSLLDKAKSSEDTDQFD